MPLRHVAGEPWRRALGTPKELRFTPGRRRKAWNRNVVALGLAAGFLEPLEATGIHLIQRGIAMLLKFFPDRDFATADVDRYNRMLEFEFSRVRDFLLMHYTQTERSGAFWEHCRAIPLTDSLLEKIELFRSHGRILREDTELFPVISWLSVMVGQNIIPRRYDPLVDSLDPHKIQAKLEELRTGIKGCVESMPSHWDFVHRQYKDRGFAVLGFPCDQFGHQEPGNEADIRNFCSLTYEVSFPMFSKIEVNGPGAHPLYQHLKKAMPGILGTEGIKWNFTKFLVDPQGKVVARYAPTDKPAGLAQSIEALLPA
jgi:glutathione peroxidase-family protein